MRVGHLKNRAEPLFYNIKNMASEKIVHINTINLDYEFWTKFVLVHYVNSDKTFILTS